MSLAPLSIAGLGSLGRARHQVSVGAEFHRCATGVDGDLAHFSEMSQRNRRINRIQRNSVLG
jgi:hypothetical protein